MIHSNINQSVISGFSAAKIGSDLTVTESNLFAAYNRENDGI